ncbi:LOW QUALITY PROTEIN: UPF0764 protein C16orf89 homolog [Ciconia maguari]
MQNEFSFFLSARYLKGALEERPSEHELPAQCARVESLVKEVSSLTEKVTHSLAQIPQIFQASFLYLEKMLDHLFQYYKSIFCASTMKINLEIRHGFKFSSRDLFMGNTVFFCPVSFPLVMLCGMPGFLDFYKLRWLEKILTWQKPEEGCFGEPNFEHTSGAVDQKQLLRTVKRREKLFAGAAFLSP